ncbi:choice-of-anchor D domain-containing protein [Myxococcota bacterium]|nr:choice-of-anchor D domain-containing protein [Myxococcota bacterium]
MLPIAALAVAAACDDGGGGISVVSGDGSFAPEVLDFGEKPVGETYSIDAVLTNLGTADAMVRSVRFEPESDAFAARQESGSPLRGAFLRRGGRVDLSVLFAPRASGDFSTTMIVGLGDVEVGLPIKALARTPTPAELRVTPSAVAFVDVAVGQRVTQAISVTNVGEAAGMLRSARLVEGDPSVFDLTAQGGGPAAPSAPISGEAREALPLVVHFEPTAPGTYQARWELTLDGDDPVTVTASGTSLPAGVLSCASDTIELGAVERGQGARATVRCSASVGPWVLGQVRLSPESSSLFSVTDVPAGLSEARTLDFTVVFASRGLPAAHAGVVEIVAEHGAVTRVFVSAEVVPPVASTQDVAVSLTWDTEHTDIDLHLVRDGATPFSTGDDCYFAMKSPDWGTPGDDGDDPFLDRDATDGYGPEVINLTRATDRVYDVWIHYYNHGTPTSVPTRVTVEWAVRGGAPGNALMLLSACGTAWRVGRFRFDVTPPVFEPDDLVTDAYRSFSADRCR